MTDRGDLAVSTETGRCIAETARGWIGTPYRHQGSRCGGGTDCLGLIRGVWRQVYGEEAEHPLAYGRDFAGGEEAERLFAAARRHCRQVDACAGPGAGDLLLFRWRHGDPASHCAIALDRDRFVHAYSGYGVVSSELTEPWRARIASRFVFPPIGMQTGSGERDSWQRSS